MEEEKQTTSDSTTSTITQPSELETPIPALKQHLGFKSSTLPQHEELKLYLQSQLTSDPYNKFCVDCKRGHSSHACLSYGIFVCTACAHIHQVAFAGKSRSGVKDVFGEQWDDLQLEAIAPGIGGNRAFYTYLQEYEGLSELPIEKKYKSEQVGWYMKRLAAHIDQRVFSEKQPAKDWDERFERAKNSVKSLITRTEKKLTTTNHSSEEVKEAAAVVAPEGEENKPSTTAVIEQKTKEWGSKIKGFFKEKFKKNTQAPPSGEEVAPQQEVFAVVEAVPEVSTDKSEESPAVECKKEAAAVVQENKTVDAVEQEAVAAVEKSAE